MEARVGAAVALTLVAASLTACDRGDGGEGMPQVAPIVASRANSDTTVVVGSGPSTTQRVLGEVVAQALDAGGFRVRRRTDLDDGRDALDRARVDVLAVPVAEELAASGRSWHDIPRDTATAFERAERDIRQRDLRAYGPAPFTVSNVVVTTQSKADELDLEQVSDAKRHESELILFVPPGCRPRADCLAGLRDVYGIYFRNVVEVWQFGDIVEGPATVAVTPATDPLIRRRGYVVLEDDRAIRRPQSPMLLVRDETARAGGRALGAIAERALATLTVGAMRRLNGLVKLDGAAPGQAVAEHLRSAGLVRARE